jgi:HlyD family secretion protein
MRQERPAVRTVYILKSSADKSLAKPEPVQVRTGITDGSTTEVLDGLNDGDLVVTGIISADQPAGGAAPTNPFGGGGRGGFGRRL